jgi:hypothetical protein
MNKPKRHQHVYVIRIEDGELKSYAWENEELAIKDIAKSPNTVLVIKGNMLRVIPQGIKLEEAYPNS